MTPARICELCYRRFHETGVDGKYQSRKVVLQLRFAFHCNILCGTACLAWDELWEVVLAGAARKSDTIEKSMEDANGYGRDIQDYVVFRAPPTDQRGMLT